MTTVDHTRRRVAPLPPDDRRAALIAATLPLLVEHGTAVSTRQIALAAGVAEGTIFRVFPDKKSLILATVTHSLTADPALDVLESIPSHHDLRRRLVAATVILEARFQRDARLHAVARELATECGPSSAFMANLADMRMRLVQALTDVIAPDRDRLRVGPATAARLLLSMVIAGHGHMFGELDPIHSGEIVGVLLDGLLVHPHDTATDPTKESPC